MKCFIMLLHVTKNNANPIYLISGGNLYNTGQAPDAY